MRGGREAWGEHSGPDVLEQQQAGVTEHSEEQR